MLSVNLLCLVILGMLIHTYSCAQFISSGADHGFFLCTDSTVSGWGYNNYGEVGNGAKKGKC